MSFIENVLPTIAQIANTIFSLCLGFMAAYYTSLVLGWPISLFLVFITVANEVIDMLIQTNPEVEGNSKLPEWIRGLKLHRHPNKSFFGAALLIILGTWQAGMRIFMFTRTFLINQTIKSLSSAVILRWALFVGGCAAVFNLSNFILNFWKFWNHEVKQVPSSTEINQIDESIEFNEYSEELPKGGFKVFLSKNTWVFDKVVGLCMMGGAMLYFIGDYKNLCNLAALAAASGQTGWLMRGAIGVMTRTVFGVPVAAFIHGAYAYLNQMVLWGFNNKKFYMNHMDGTDQDKANKLPLIGWFHFDPTTRRFVLYGRELILCSIDIFNALLIVPTFGLALGITSLIATMFCRWVVYYFQSREEPIDKTATWKLFKSKHDAVYDSIAKKAAIRKAELGDAVRKAKDGEVDLEHDGKGFNF